MRRRLQEGQVPPLLARFDRSDWSGTTEQRLAAWSQARRTLYEANGTWPGGPATMIAYEVETRRLLHGWVRGREGHLVPPSQPGPL